MVARCRHLLKSSYGLSMHRFLRLIANCEIVVCRYTCTGSLHQRPYSERHRALTWCVEGAQSCLCMIRLDGGRAGAGIEGC